MADSKIKYYPVDNGDMSLILLQDDTSILVDCNIRQSSIGSNDSKIYDVKKDLLYSIKKRDSNPFVDVFVLTHGDCDHCRGFKSNFYQGDPTKYSAEDRKENKILIDEMWFSPMIAEEHTNDDEDAYQQEAERRIELHRKKSADRDKTGNRIKIIGYDGNKDYKDIDHLRATPGTVVDEFNGKKQTTFSVFIHAPFKEHLASAEKDKNSTSIVFQARFKNASYDSKYACLAMFGGDSDHYSWEIILEKTKRYKNDKKEQALDWDIFLAPHHCSWSFFNDRPQADNPEPKANSLEVLDYKRTGGKIIASCKKILDEKPNPPHYEAKEEYVKKLDKAADFLNTAVYPKESELKPIEFTVTSGGPTLSPTSKVGSAIGSAGGLGAASTVVKQG
ncbi:cobyric acid synthase CobQ [Rufibacter glacialis]|uniref:Cobyric acid synthase CobQ n=1 Tax=Rufibacter glacialis TaxID=1259555 RepID=A0A5M8Q9P6_9BACT|nr:cobyric acid synthase CobQ [Rufibacter glacialis]KAA6431878.1 cobyric acid synthase CobQ [Rufibacter glacialis]GGK80773.1 hypothetical protein GCM10011405_30660 [Rufibacter glacialis]